MTRILKISTLLYLLFLSINAFACDKNTFSYVIINNGDGTWTMVVNGCMEISNNNGCGGPTQFAIVGNGGNPLNGMVSATPASHTFPNGTTWNLTQTSTSAVWTGTQLPSSATGGLSNPE